MSAEVVFISFEWVTRALFIGSMEGVSSASPVSLLILSLIVFADKGEIYIKSSSPNSHITRRNKHTMILSVDADVIVFLIT